MKYQKFKEEPFIIAEIGSNHNGDMDLAKKIIDEAHAAGAHAVKFQSWTDKTLISELEYKNNQVYTDSPKKHFGSLHEMVERYYLRESQHWELKEYCDEKGIIFCSTPFSNQEVDLLEELEVPFYKIASMDINNYRLLRHVAKTNKPIILSTGMSTLEEIKRAIHVIESENNFEIVILHCISIYPPKTKDIHLLNIAMLETEFPQYIIGFSDHSIGTSIPLAAVALGATVIEKHFTIDKDLEGWDHEISANPPELREIVLQSQIIHKALGQKVRTVSPDEEQKKLKFRRSIFINTSKQKDEVITEDDLVFLRPGTGISPDEEVNIVGKRINKDIAENHMLTWDDFCE